MKKDLCRCGNVDLVVYLLVIFFGISSWLDINGLFVELPILVQNLPEGWDLPSYMSVIIQVANIAPLMYTVASTLWPHRKFDVPVIYIIICLGGVTCLLLAFLWSVTSYIAGREHSTALFVLQFFLALVDCTSSVAFLPYMTAFKPQYMIAYFIGEGFSGLIPSLVALGQGAGSIKCVSVSNFQNQTTQNKTQISQNYTAFGVQDFILNATSLDSAVNETDSVQLSPKIISFPVYQEPRFSVRTFFLMLMLLMILSSLAFTLLNFWSYCQREKVMTPSELHSNPRLRDSERNTSTEFTSVDDADTTRASMKRKKQEKHLISCNRNTKKTDYDNSTFLLQMPSLETNKLSTVMGEVGFKSTARNMPQVKYSSFLLLTGLLNAVSNGLLPSMQTYSCLPYGIEEYHLSVTLANIANPLACFVSFLVKMKSLTWTFLMTTVGMVLTGYLVWTAYASPNPLLVNHPAGSFILISCWILAVFVITYTKVSIATEFREEGKKALLWIGASSQAGSLLGAVSTFVVVNVFNLFHTANPCM